MQTIGLKPQATGSTASRIQVVHTASGISAWLVEDYTVPLVAVEAAFIGGSSQETDAESGGLSMLMDLLGEGAGTLDSRAFQEKLEDKAIEFSSSAGKDGLRLSMRTLSRNTADAFLLAALAINDARLDQDAIERVRAQTIAGFKRDEFDPDYIAGRRWFEIAFAGHPYAREDRGSLKSVQALTRDQLVGLRSRLMTRDTLRIGVVGAIDAKTLATELDRVFGALPKSGAVVAIPEATPLQLGSRHVIDLDVAQSTIRFGAIGPKRRDPDFMAQFVVNHILGGGVFQARLFKEVREKRGLAYSVSSSLYPLLRSSLIYGGTATKNERALESMTVIEDEIAKLADAGPDEAELMKAKSFITGSYALRFDTSGKIASQLVQIQLDELGIDYTDRRNAEVEAVGMPEAKAAARKLLGPGQLLVTVVGRPVGM